MGGQRNLATIFGQKRNLLRRPSGPCCRHPALQPREHGLARAGASGQRGPAATSGGRANTPRLRRLVPAADGAAIWSCPTGQMRDMPLATFVRFCQNHGLLQIFDRPMWRTVRGGGRENTSTRSPRSSTISASPAGAARDARSRLACRRRRARRQRALRSGRAGLPQRPSARDPGHGQRRPARGAVGDPLPAQPRRAAHRWRLLPRDRKLWSAWNYFAGHGEPRQTSRSAFPPDQPLQPLPFETPVVVTLNPAANPTRRRSSPSSTTTTRFSTPRPSPAAAPGRRQAGQGEVVSGWPAPGAATASTRTA